MIGLWVFVLLNSFVIFLWNFLTEGIAPIKKTVHGKKIPPTKMEQRLSSQLHIDIIINLAFILLIGWLYYKIWIRKREKKQHATRLLAAINEMTKQWKDVYPSLAANPDGGEGAAAPGAPSEPPTDVECCICMDTYTPETYVIQLKCHVSHVYPLECFSKFLEGVGEDIG